jgi:hypothetical protein
VSDLKSKFPKWTIDILHPYQPPSY